MSQAPTAAPGIPAGTSMAAAGLLSRLPDDILGMVLARLDSPLDHARFAAACKSWRDLVSTRPPRRVHPWLVLDPHDGGETKRVHCPGDGAAVLPLVTRLHETTAVAGGIRRFVGCHAGGWVAHEAPLRITNVFSGAEVGLPEDKRRSIVTLKVIFSEPPTTSHCILAAITDMDEVAIRRPKCGWTLRRFYGKPVFDITFRNGHLYCLIGRFKEIVMFKVGLNEYGMPVFGAPYSMVTGNPSIIQHRYLESEGDPDAHAIYLVELGGKLVMAVRRTWGPWPLSCKIPGPFFLVFELVADADPHELTMTQLCKWVEVTSLGDQALFLGPTCSKSMPVSTGEHGGPRRNHIYYSHHRCYNHKIRIPDSAKEFLANSNNENRRVYYKEDEIIDGGVEGIKSVGYYVCGDGHPPMWLFPPDF